MRADEFDRVRQLCDVVARNRHTQTIGEMRFVEPANRMHDQMARTLSQHCHPMLVMRRRQTVIRDVDAMKISDDPVDLRIAKDAVRGGSGAYFKVQLRGLLTRVLERFR